MTSKMNLEITSPEASAKYPYSVPELPYSYDSLDAVIDEQTMRVHHDKHHKAYTDKFNAALEQQSSLQGKSLIEILSDLGSLPDDIRNAVRNNGGGYLNHALFWPMLSESGGGEPGGDLAEAINREFGAFDQFKKRFSNAAATLFGSGWAWLVADANGKLDVIQTANQDTPLMKGKKPVLGLDVWEHAYYLRYQNRRPEYIENFWQIVNWEQCSRNYSA